MFPFICRDSNRIQYAPRPWNAAFFSAQDGGVARNDGVFITALVWPCKLAYLCTMNLTTLVTDLTNKSIKPLNFTNISHFESESHFSGAGGSGSNGDTPTHPSPPRRLDLGAYSASTLKHLHWEFLHGYAGDQEVLAGRAVLNGYETEVCIEIHTEGKNTITVVSATSRNADWYFPHSFNCNKIRKASI